jgi:hypothetical protein
MGRVASTLAVFAALVAPLAAEEGPLGNLERVRRGVAAASRPGRLQLGPVLSRRTAADGAPDFLWFESQVEVLDKLPVDPNMALALCLRDLDLRYGPGAEGAPTRSEMESHRPHVTQGANLLPLLEWLFKQATKEKDAMQP